VLLPLLMLGEFWGGLLRWLWGAGSSIIPSPGAAFVVRGIISVALARISSLIFFFLFFCKYIIIF